jgi:hypothetical protein
MTVNAQLETTRDTPADYSDRIINTFILFFQEVFAGNNEFTFIEDESLTKLMILDKFPSNLDSVGKKPALVTDLQPITKSDSFLDDRAGYRHPEHYLGKVTRTDLFNTVLVIHSISQFYAQSRRLSFLVGGCVYGFEKVLLAKGMHELSVPTVVGSPVKLITSSRGEVEISQEFVDPTPDLTSPILRSVLVGEHFQIETDLSLGVYPGSAATSPIVYPYPSLLSGATILPAEVTLKIVDVNGTFDLTPTTDFTAGTSDVTVKAFAAGVMRRDVLMASSVSGVSDNNAVAGTANFSDVNVNYVTSGIANADEVVIVAPSANAGTYYAKIIDINSLELFDDAALTTRATLTDAIEESYTITNDHILEGSLLVSYRAQRNDLIGVVKLINRQQDMVTFAGIADELNPLGLAAAIHNAAAPGIAFYVTALTADDATAHQAGLDELEDELAYTLVPLHQNDDELDVSSLYKSHVEDGSLPENGKFRITLLSRTVPAVFNRVASHTEVAAAVIANGAGPNELLLTDVGEDFLSKGVVAGDLVKISASTPAAYTSASPFIVKSATATSITMIGDWVALGSANATSVTYSVDSPDLTTFEQAEYMGEYTEGILCRRVTNLVAGRGEVKTIFTGDTWVPSYFANASLAGLISFLPPQQGLSTFTLPGITDIRHPVAGRFKRADMNEMGSRGNLIIVKPSEGSPVSIRRQRTTNTDTTADGELSITKDVDFGSFYLIGALDPFLGKYNMVASFFSQVQVVLDSVRHNLTAGEIPGIGPVFTEMDILSFEPVPGTKDEAELIMDVKPPYPVNKMRVRLLIS